MGQAHRLYRSGLAHATVSCVRLNLAHSTPPMDFSHSSKLEELPVPKP